MGRCTQVFAILPLVLIVGIPFALRPARQADEQADPSARLVILSPHNEQIRYEFGRAFNDHRLSQGKSPIEFDWRTPGGTSDLIRIIESSFVERAKKGVADRGIGYDMLFGGGDFYFDILARGYTAEVDGQDVHVPVLAPIDLTRQQLDAIYGGQTLADKYLYRLDEQGRPIWIGATLSSFGIVYNRDRLAMLGVPEPTTWADLAQGAYLNELALADPSHSGSIAATYNTILQRHGWTEGWRILRRMGGNARYFSSGASAVPVDVSAGEAAAGLCIDFYGRFQAGAVARQRVGYVDPPRMTSITADPIGILVGAEHMALAQEFAAWVVSPEAQALWQRRVGAPGGPQRFELRRVPIRPDMYHEQEMALWVDQVRPFEIAEPVAEGTPDFFSAVAVVMQATAISVHADLKLAWKAMLVHPDHLNRSRMQALFDAMPPELDLTPADDPRVQPHLAAYRDPDHPEHDTARRALESLLVARLKARYKQSDDPDLSYRDRARWTRFFQDNYRQVVALSEQ